jgi:ubiquinone/menaquinone biosynthesis C-methylase UbiE
MVISKEWNWAKVDDGIWEKPSEDIYYYINRWKENGYNTFLDLGCGLGRHSILFALNGFETYSLDLSEFGLASLSEKAKNLGLNIKTCKADINKLPYEDDFFDCLLAYHVISHTDSEGIKIILSEIKRVLKTDGEFFITLCSKESPGFKLENCQRIDENTIIKTEEPEMGIPHFYSDLDGVKRLLSDFQIIKIRHIEDIWETGSSCHYFIHGKRI